VRAPELSLLLPEWQGYGLGADVHHGATSLAAQWFGDGADVLKIDAPVTEAEPLRVDDGVLGLASIAPRFVHALHALGERAPDRIRVAGGTCGVELAPIAYLNERYAGDLAVLWLDAHADLNTPQSSPSAHFHGMVLRSLLGDGPRALVEHIARPLTPRQVVLVGPRDLDQAEADFVRDADIALLGDNAFSDFHVIDRWLASRSVRRLYIHFDVDVLAMSAFDGALLPTPPGGPTLAQASALIAHLRSRYDVVGLSVLELCDRGGAIRQVVSALGDAPPAFPQV
jgi:arginase